MRAKNEIKIVKKQNIGFSGDKMLQLVSGMKLNKSISPSGKL